MDLPVTQSVKHRSHQRLPVWLKKKLGPHGALHDMKRVLRQHSLHTVCEEASCPNRGECWSAGTATFMILGGICTRHCGFCDVKAGVPEPVDPDEPRQLAEMVKELGLRHVVITCVARDDLEDRGAEQFMKCIREVRSQYTEVKIEILTTDFSLKYEVIDEVLAAKPDVFNHNIETVHRLSPKVRHRASYENSLRFLAYLKEKSPEQLTKSGLMLGLGETEDEVVEALKDLRGVGCEVLTIGQYLRPSHKNLAVEAFIKPDMFQEYGRRATEMGFHSVASGPFVRSSYHAEEMIDGMKKS